MPCSLIQPLTSTTIIYMLKGWNMSSKRKHKHRMIYKFSHPDMGCKWIHPFKGGIHPKSGSKLIHPNMGSKQIYPLQGSIHPKLGSKWFHPLKGSIHPKLGSKWFHPLKGCNHPKTGRQNHLAIGGQSIPNTGRWNHHINSGELCQRHIHWKPLNQGCIGAYRWITIDGYKLRYNSHPSYSNPLLK